MRILKADVTAGARDAVLAILGSGLRRTEVVSLELSDFGSTLVQLGAGVARAAKTGRCTTSSGIRAVSAWLRVRGWRGPLLYPVSKGHRVNATTLD